MLDQLDYYDLLGIVIPGVLLSYWVPICFPVVTEIVAVTAFPETVGVIAFVGLVLFVGHLVQAVASMIERPLYWTWGGRPSDYVFQRGLGRRYLELDEAQRIRSVLAAEYDPDASDGALFRVAMERSRIAPNSRVQLFNSLFAFHRGLLVVLVIAVLLIIGSYNWGAADGWSGTRFITVLGILAALTGLVWRRAMQRALYYVQAVLVTAERVIRQAT